MPTECNTAPWTASLGSLIGSMPCFSFGSQACGVRWPIMWLKTLLFRPTSPQPSLWLICLRIGTDNNWKLGRTVPKVNWFFPSTGFDFLLKSFWCGRIRKKKIGLESQLCCLQLSDFGQVSGVSCVSPAPCIFLLASLSFSTYLPSSSTAWWLRGGSLGPDINAGFSTPQLYDTGQVT